MRATEFTETVNDKIFWSDFHKERQILDGQYILVATAGYVGYGAKPEHKSTQFRIVAKTANGAEVGWVNFENKDGTLEALDLSIQPAHRRRGIATEMYRLARELGNDIAPSKMQTGMGKQFWNKDHSKEIDEEIIDEMPLPADWDPAQMKQQGTSFKSRLAYALERARKLGTGSSRVATVIDYQGRPTVLKIAKNQKGLTQNSVEADILSDGYASQMGILIPIIDYDMQNREPTWVHTEQATKVTEKQLCKIIHCDDLRELTLVAEALLGKNKAPRYQVADVAEKKRFFGMSEEDIETFFEYVNKLAELNNSFDVELGDFSRAANWGLYQGHPVIIDVGFNSNIMNQYYSR
jgi:GNAT superfamily N-acetyltransferase